MKVSQECSEGSGFAGFIAFESAVGVKFVVTDLVLGLSVQRSIEINDSLPADGEQHLWKLPLQTVLCLTSTPFHLHKHKHTALFFSPTHHVIYCISSESSKEQHEAKSAFKSINGGQKSLRKV